MGFLSKLFGKKEELKRPQVREDAALIKTLEGH